MANTVLARRGLLFFMWIALVYSSYVIIILAVSAFKGRFSFSLFTSPRGQFLLLIPSAIPAALTTLALWALPIRRTLSGAIIGIVVAVGGLALSTLLEMKLLGSFEANPGIGLEALIMLLPTCVAGAYAGVVCSKRLL